MQDALKGLINTDANKALSSFSLLVGIPFPAPYDISEVRVEERREIGEMGVELQRASERALAVPRCHSTRCTQVYTLTARRLTVYTVASLLAPQPTLAASLYPQADFSVVRAASDTATPAHISFLLHGEVYRKGAHAEPPFPAPASLPDHDATLGGRMAEFIIHPFVIESLGEVFLKAGLAQVNITNSMIPANFPLQLNTSAFTDIAPGLAKA